ncbi:MAG: hypothetical protein RR928_14205, partial [Comamonas sp.]|uniref:hypothetical protein n=1 Tax=Comamonas sp. TaxID=34028 RepID=UPI002FCB7A43
MSGPKAMRGDPRLTFNGHPGIDQEFGACQQFLDPAGPVRGQAREYVLQAGIGSCPFQAHHRGRAQAAGEQY